MKKLIIDSSENNEFSETLLSSFNELDNSNCTLHNSDKNPCEIAEEIIKQYPNNFSTEKDEKKDPYILFINIEGKYGGAKRQELKGIKILKWLRLKNITNHCIMFSFLPLDKIVKMNPANSILLSKGVTFLRAAFTLPVLTDKKYNEKSERENLLPFFRGEIDLKKIRHELANIWGAKRMNELLNLKSEEETTDYKIDVLKYLAPVSVIKNKHETTLNTLLKNIKLKNEKIYYYDDMCEMWTPALNKLFNGKVSSFNPKNISSDDLLTKIENNEPECLLLDLRLENEKDSKDVLEYSGGKLLLELKKRKYTLPVIIFTASNKAESVRQLLDAGAEFVWTKEGVDDGIDDLRTLNSAETLVREVVKAVSKFKNKTYKKIYAVERMLNEIEMKNDIYNFSKRKHIIYVDTNFLIDSITKNYLHLFYKLLLSKPSNWWIKIHEDVLREIFVISQQDESKDHKNNEYRVPVCRFLLEKLIEWRQRRLIWIEIKGGQAEAMKEAANINLPESPQKICYENQVKERKSFIKRLFIIAEDNQQRQLLDINAKINDINSSIDQINKVKENLPDFEKLRLHADNTFINIIPEDLKTGNVIFFTADHNCAYDVGKYFEINKDEFSVTKIKKFNLINNEDQKDFPIEVYCSVKFNGNSFKNYYMHKLNYQFKSWINNMNKPQ